MDGTDEVQWSPAIHVSAGTLRAARTGKSCAKAAYRRPTVPTGWFGQLPPRGSPANPRASSLFQVWADAEGRC
jgi:hypothetical protein